MKCYACDHALIWGGDEDTDDDDDHLILTNLHCPNCESFVLVYHGQRQKDVDEG